MGPEEQHLMYQYIFIPITPWLKIVTQHFSRFPSLLTERHVHPTSLTPSQALVLQLRLVGIRAGSNDMRRLTRHYHESGYRTSRASSRYKTEIITSLASSPNMQMRTLPPLFCNAYLPHDSVLAPCIPDCQTRDWSFTMTMNLFVMTAFHPYKTKLIHSPSHLLTLPIVSIWEQLRSFIHRR